MPRSILDVEINDANFRSFMRQFTQYQAAVNRMPQQWRATNQQIAGTRVSFQALVNQYRLQIEQSRLNAIAMAAAERSARGMSDYWRDMTRSAREFAASISGATASILRWTGGVSLLSGVVGGASLFGLDRMAQGVAATRRSSLGLGMGYGEQRAFGIQFGRLVDPGSFLGSLSQVMGSADKSALFGAGLTPGEMHGSTGQVGVAVLRRLKALADRTDPERLGTVVEARNLGALGITAEDLRRLRATGPGEFNKLIAGYGGGVGPHDLPAATQLSYQNLVTQFDDAWERIKNTFVKQLVGLADPLSDLSKSFEKTVQVFLGNEKIGEWIKSAGAGLESLAKYIGTDEFQTSMKEFATGLVGLANTITTFVKWFAPKAMAQEDQVKLFTPFGDIPLGFTGSDVINKFKSFGTNRSIAGVTGSIDSVAMVKRITAAYRGAGYSDAQIAGVLAAAQSESSFDPVNATGDGGSAHGLFQWRNERFQALQAFAAARGTSWQDPQTQIDFSLQELRGTISGSMLRGATSARDASLAMSNYERHQGYSDPNNPDTANRIRLANQFQAVVSIHNAAGSDVVTQTNYVAPQGSYPSGGF